LVGLDARVSIHAADTALANRINATMAPGHDPNRRFTGWNIAAVASDGIFFLLAVIGSFVPDT
jgi:hypothetical protein